jgi:hypothetical protein
MQTEPRQAIRDLDDKRQTLLANQLELDERHLMALKRGRLPPKNGGTTIEETNATTAKIAAEQKVISTELVELEISIAEMTALLPVELKTPDLKDIITLFEYAFNARTPGDAINAALGRLRRLTKG